MKTATKHCKGERKHSDDEKKKLCQKKTNSHELEHVSRLLCAKQECQIINVDFRKEVV